VAALNGRTEDAATVASAPDATPVVEADDVTPQTQSESDAAPAPKTRATPATEPAAAERAPAVIAEVGTLVAGDDAEPVQTVAQPAAIGEPVVRPRRKRGRVVAPAGPPRGAEAESSEPAPATEPEPSPEFEPAPESASADLEQAEGDR
jgi:ribonuclease E